MANPTTSVNNPSRIRQFFQLFGAFFKSLYLQFWSYFCMVVGIGMVGMYAKQAFSQYQFRRSYSILSRLFDSVKKQSYTKDEAIAAIKATHHLDQTKKEHTSELITTQYTHNLPLTTQQIISYFNQRQQQITYGEEIFLGSWGGFVAGFNYYLARQGAEHPLWSAGAALVAMVPALGLTEGNRRLRGYFAQNRPV